MSNAQAAKSATPHGIADPDALHNRLRRYRGAIIGIGLVLLIAAIVYAVASHAQAQNDRQGLRALFKAELAMRKNENATAADRIKAIDAVIAEYGDAGPVARQGLLTIFALQRAEGQSTAALHTARRFLANFPRHAFAPDMRLALVRLLTAPEQADEAAAELAKLEKNVPAHLAPDVALLRGQIALAQAEAAPTDSAARRQHWERARQELQTCTEQVRDQQWPPIFGAIARFELNNVQDRLAGRTPLPPSASLTPATAPQPVSIPFIDNDVPAADADAEPPAPPPAVEAAGGVDAPPTPPAE